MSEEGKDSYRHHHQQQADQPPPPPPHYGTFQGVANYPPQPVIGFPQPMPPPGSSGPSPQYYAHGYQASVPGPPPPPSFSLSKYISTHTYMYVQNICISICLWFKNSVGSLNFIQPVMLKFRDQKQLKIYLHDINYWTGMKFLTFKRYFKGNSSQKQARREFVFVSGQLAVLRGFCWDQN